MTIEGIKPLERTLGEARNKITMELKSRDDVLNTLKLVEECLIHTN